MLYARTEKSIKDAYKQYAERIWEQQYDSPYLIRRYIHRRRYDCLLRHVKPGMRILDVGCGEGIFSCLAAQRGAEVVACDISMANIQVAEEKSAELGMQDRIKFLIADAEDLPFKGSSFEMVVSSQVLEHLPNLQRGLKMIWEKTYDKAIIAIPTCLSPSSMAILGGDKPWKVSRRTPIALLRGGYLVIRNIFGKGVYERYGTGQELPHVWFYPWIIKKYLRNAGFKIVDTEAASLCLPYLSAIIPKTIHLMKLMDRIKDIQPFDGLGYGMAILVEKKPWPQS